MADRKRPHGKLHLTFRGRTLSVADWAVALDWNADVIYSRLRKGWPVERVLTAPVVHGGARRPPRIITHDDRTQPLTTWADEIGVSVRTLRKRLATLPVEEALSAAQRSRRLLVFQSRAQGVRAWALELGIPLKRLEKRLRLGWSVERALTTGRIGRRKRPGTTPSLPVRRPPPPRHPGAAHRPR
jgi:hypothetical protein